MMQVAVKVGGICMGAFGPGGGVRGFVFGVTGVRRGEPAHWSHMLAVRSEARDQGLGRRLKLAQADALRAAGVKTVYWTYDPLVARNAHLNLNLLGATVDEYVPDMYGRSDSDLHRLGTDRFVVKWCLEGEGGAPGGGSPRRRASVVVAPEGVAREGAPGGGDYAEAEVVEVLIPGDIEAVEARSVEEALAWRETTRRAFTRLLGAGARVAGFSRDREYGRYLVVRKPAS